MSIASLLRRKARAPAQPPVTQERRSIGLDGREVPYVLRRSARKSLALQLDSKGVRVSVPAGAALAEVERFICAHARWLLERLDAQARAQQLRRESFHRLNNAIAGVRANLDFLALAFEGEAAAAPFLADATPEQRANVLQALHYALESSERLVAMTHAALDGTG